MHFTLIAMLALAFTTIIFAADQPLNTNLPDGAVVRIPQTNMYLPFGPLRITPDGRYLTSEKEEWIDLTTYKPCAKPNNASDIHPRWNYRKEELKVNGEKRYALDVSERTESGKEPTWQRLAILDRKCYVLRENKDGMVLLCEDTTDDKRPQRLFVLHRQAGKQVPINIPPHQDGDRITATPFHPMASLLS